MLELSLRLLDVVVHSSGCLDIRDVTQDKGDGLFELDGRQRRRAPYTPLQDKPGGGDVKAFIRYSKSRACIHCAWARDYDDHQPVLATMLVYLPGSSLLIHRSIPHAVLPSEHSPDACKAISAKTSPERPPQLGQQAS